MGRGVRGEIWTVAGGGYAPKPRPALIIQDDRFRDVGSLTVVPLM
ncbi:type II toxin-antitoxin system PemK/MazF family toxin [Arthrobacter woluwensis]|nr:type II toxin-antitoxin system PemK/MazF family toxin [Arthrobacter woluwensis]